MTSCSTPLSLYWLPPPGDFDAAATALQDAGTTPEDRLAGLVSLANRRLDFMQTGRLDRLARGLADTLPANAPRLRLAILGSGTLDHLAPGIRVGALRRGLLVDIHIGGYGQWRQEILDPGSTLHAFGPDAVLLALDHEAVLAELPLTASEEEAEEAVDRAAAELAGLWRTLRERSGAAVIQQTVWFDDPPLFGHFERSVPASPGALADRLDSRLARMAAGENVALLDLRSACAGIGTRHIADPSLWHHAKQTVSPAAVPWVGDQAGRILAALRGLSKKVLVLDLDNTLWGGTIGDDGLEGIVLGPGSGAGEAYVSFQRYVRRLAGRGIVLAVSSKNDRAIAESAFSDHPEMVLALDDFAAFECDWNDKPSALVRIAKALNLGLESLVFADDNPVERALVRQTLPAVAVPELPEAPELYARCIADAGYFEAVSFTADDAARNRSYAANRKREAMQSAATDIDGFLRELEMTLTIGPFAAGDLPRIAQLINKTNQFNLTTRRYTEAEVRAMMDDPEVLTFAARLADRFGDNGLTSVVIGRLQPAADGIAVDLDTWLMSCRVLGRRVEHAVLNVVAKAAADAGATELIGRYGPTRKNGLVKDMYPGFGFEPRAAGDDDGCSVWALPLARASLPATDHLTIVHKE